jgi:hypothetical protein
MVIGSGSTITYRHPNFLGPIEVDASLKRLADTLLEMYEIERDYGVPEDQGGLRVKIAEKIDDRKAVEIYPVGTKLGLVTELDNELAEERGFRMLRSAELGTIIASNEWHIHIRRETPKDSDESKKEKGLPPAAA